MTSGDVRAELEKQPFIPFRLHLVSGKTLDVLDPSAASMLRNAVLVFQRSPQASPDSEGYDLVALRNVERIEQMRAE